MTLQVSKTALKTLIYIKCQFTQIKQANIFDKYMYKLCMHCVHVTAEARLIIAYIFIYTVATQ